MFKSKNTPLQFKHIQTFEKEFSENIPSIKFRFIKDTFQKNVKEDIPKIKQSPNVFVFAEKTSNIYEMSEQQCVKYSSRQRPKYT